MALRTTEVIFIRFLFIFLIIFSITPLWALESDSVRLSDLSSQKIVEHIIYESFLEKNHKAEEMIGYQIDYYFHPQWYFGIAVHGVIQGRNSGGFGIAGFGLGYHYTIFNVEGDTKLLIGSGGAGV